MTHYLINKLFDLYMLPCFITCDCVHNGNEPFTDHLSWVDISVDGLLVIIQRVHFIVSQHGSWTAL